MKRDDFIARRIELAGLKGHAGIETLAGVAAFSRNPKWQNLLEKIVEPLASSAVDPHPFPSPDELRMGDIHLGSAVMMSGGALDRVFFPKIAFTGDILAVGAKGTGKSWLIAYICQQLVKAGVTTIILDTEDEYAPMLVPHIPSDEMAVYDINTFKMNFLEPVGGEPMEHAKARVQRLLREEWLRDGSINMLGEILNAEYAERMPTVCGIVARLEKMKFRVHARYAEYWESLVNRFRFLNDIPLFQCQRGMPLDVLLRRSSIFRLNGLSQEQLGFVIRSVMSATARLLEERGCSAVFVLDEFHRIATRESVNRNDRGEPLVLELARTLRKRGGGLVIGDNVPSRLPRQVISTSNTKIIFRLGSGDDVWDIGNSLALDAEQRAYMMEIPDRHAVVYCAYAGWPRAFLVRLPELDFSQRAGRQEIEQRMSASVEGLAWAPVERFAQPGIRPAEANGGQERKEQASRQRVSIRAANYLVDVNRRPFLYSGRRDASLKLSGWLGHKLREELVDAGLIRLHHMRTGKRGGVLLLTEVTNEGFEYLRELDEPVKGRPGKGGFLHQAAQHYVREYYRALRPGAIVTIEDGSSGKAVDVSVVGEGKTLAVEICNVGEMKELRNIEADLRTYDEVLVVCEDPDTLEGLRDRVRESFDERDRERIRFKLLTSFIEQGEERGREKKKER